MGHMVKYCVWYFVCDVTLNCVDRGGQLCKCIVERVCIVTHIEAGHAVFHFVGTRMCEQTPISLYVRCCSGQKKHDK